MRKSVVVCFLMLAAFCFESAWSSSYQIQCFNCCRIREASAEVNLGIRSDDFEWKFKDSSIKSVLSAVEPIAANFGDDVAAIITGLDDSSIGCLLDSAFRFTNSYSNHWKKLRMANIGFEAKVDTDCCVYAKAKGNWGWICDGRYDPSGLFANNFEFFNDATSDYGIGSPGSKRVRGDVWDISGGIGYNFRCWCNTFQIAPLVGWYYNNIHVHTDKYKNFTVLAAQIKNIGGIGGTLVDLPDLGFLFIDSRSSARHNASWTGPWVGFDATYQWDCRLSFVANFQYVYARQTGSGDSRTRNKFAISDVVPSDIEDIDDLTGDSFALSLDAEHYFKTRVNVRGVFIGGGANYNINDCWYAGFHIDYWNLRKAQTGDVKLESRGKLLVFQDATADTPVLIENKQHECLNYMKYNSLRFNVVIGFDY